MQVSGQLYVVSAPSGAGKTSLLSALLKQLDQVSVSISHTTRAQRPGEEDGVNYHFVGAAGFQQMVAAGEFLEHAQVFSHYYGTAKSSIEALLQQGQDVILEIDWQGARQIREWRPDLVSIFILPPSQQALQERLQKRGQDKAEVIAQRMAAAIGEMEHFAEYDFLVINDQFERALADLIAIFHSQRLSRPYQQQKQQSLLQQLLSQGSKIQ